MPEREDNSAALTSDYDLLPGDYEHSARKPPFLSPEPQRRSWRMATWAASVAAVLIISLLASMVVVTHGRTGKSAGHLTTSAPTATPEDSPQSSFSAIGMASANDGWVASDVYSNHGTSSVLGTTLRYVNGQWQPVQPAIGSSIRTITMLSPTDGWALGAGVYHYDGVRWQPTALPGSIGPDGTVSFDATFDAISALSPTNVWIAGQDPQFSRGIIEHFDGKSWAVQNLPVQPVNTNITGIAMVSATDGWAVGFAYGEPDKNGNALSTAVVLRYHNGTWTLAQTLPNHEMTSISMYSATDGWIGGDAQTPMTPQAGMPMVSTVPALWHYVGGRWMPVSVPIPAEADVLPEGQIVQLAMFSATTGWMTMSDTRQTLDDSAQVNPYIFRLEKGRWVQVETPTIRQRRIATVIQVSFVSPNEFWGVGNTLWNDLAATVTPLLVHYKAGTWTVLES